MKTRPTYPAIHAIVLVASLAFASSEAHAAELTGSDISIYDYFGHSVGISGTIGLAGSGNFQDPRTAYVFRGLDTATGTLKETVKLMPSDGTKSDNFGLPVSQSDSIALIAAVGARIGSNANQGSAYVYRNLETAMGTITQNAKLLASDGATYDLFGGSVSLSGSIGLIAAPGADIGSNVNQGAAYVFRKLDTAAGTINESVKLTASDGRAQDYFATSVSLSGNVGLVGAHFVIKQLRSAYLFRPLDTATGHIHETAQLSPADYSSSFSFGADVSLSGSIGLIGAPLAMAGVDFYPGAAYVFRGLDTATGRITESVKLAASDGGSQDRFGEAVSISSGIGLVGANECDVSGREDQGAAYLYLGLDKATGMLNQNVKLTASNGEKEDQFGHAVALDGDQFLIGAYGHFAMSGRAYSGSVSSVSTLDAGSIRKIISGISFESLDDWVVGETTDDNQVILGAGDTAIVRAAGKGVYIGKAITPNWNTLTLDGKLSTRSLSIGSPEGNSGNTVLINRSGSLRALRIRLAPRNLLMLQGRYWSVASVLRKLGTSRLKAWTGTTWETVTPENYDQYIATSFNDGYTILKARVAR